jgi:hypothetical protein
MVNPYMGIHLYGYIYPINHHLMRKTVLISIVAGLVLVACKFSELPTGTYQGTYDKSNYGSSDTLPVSSGTGILTVTKDDENHVNILFESAGNPNVNISHVRVDRLSAGFSGNAFDLYTDDYDYFANQGVGGYSQNPSGQREIRITNYDTLGFEFNGELQ